MIGYRDCCALVLLVGLPCSGCASVVSGRHAEVEVFSNVPGARVTVQDKHGNTVANASTPGTIALRRQRGLVRPKGYTATITARGYQPEQFEIKQEINPWIYGNVGLLQLGLVGWAVDNATGAVWQPDDATYYQELTPIGMAKAEPSRNRRSPKSNRSAKSRVQLASAEAFASDDGE